MIDTDRARVRDGVILDARVPKSLVHTHPGVILVLRPAQGPGTRQNRTLSIYVRLRVYTYTSIINFVVSRSHTLTPARCKKNPGLCDRIPGLRE